MNRATSMSIVIALAAASTAASAQRIEISSDSIGTVVVTPPAMSSGSAASPSVNDAGDRNRGRSGVDLGVQRRRDGSLYDPLDPNQNPAAATTTAPSNDAIRNSGAAVNSGAAAPGTTARR